MILYHAADAAEIWTWSGGLNLYDSGRNLVAGRHRACLFALIVRRRLAWADDRQEA